MAFIPVDKCALTEVIYSVSGQVCENTFWIRFPAQPVEADLEEMAQAIVGWWQDFMMELLPTNVTLTAVKLTDMTEETGAVWEEFVSSLNAGENTTGAKPNSSSFAVTFLTAERGRSKRGRNYIVALPNNGVENVNYVTAAHATSLVSAYANLRTVILGLNREMVVVSLYSGTGLDGKPLPRAFGVPTVITGFRYYDLAIDNQRRRLPGRGS